MGLRYTPPETAVAQNYPIEFGEYRLLRKLAQGGMAEIFLAQNRAGEFCAIKRILPHLAHEEGFIRMFIDEARIVSHLDHPNIAGVYDQGRHDGYYYIAMEFVQGHSLLAFTERAKATKMPLPLGLLSYVMAELLAGLGFAHTARDTKGRHLQIVHRDVTPQNVLISYDGDVKLIDFGVAKARARLTQTEAGFTKGKLAYMSPEQARGEELDGRSDLFSVGIILHEVTTNSRLFNKEGPGGILGAIVNEQIPPPSKRRKEYPKQLEGIVMKALEKDVNYRWQTAEEMRDSLLRFARKEKPVPGAPRLKELIYDLFGPADSQEVIEAAQSTSEPTPPHVLARGRPSVVEVLNSPKRDGSAPGSVTPTRPREDETRMLRAEYEINPSRVERDLRSFTSAGMPAIKVPIPEEEPPVPEPKRPFRVRAAQFMAALSSDILVSWRNHRPRWLLGMSGAAMVFALLVAAQSGVLRRVGEWLGGAAEQARTLRSSAGLVDEPVLDAGLQPTILRLQSKPPGASISVNGLGMGAVTPHDLSDLPTGRNLRVVLSMPGFRNREEEVTLPHNGGIYELALTLNKKQGALAVRSTPKGALIFLDGRSTGKKTPAVLENLQTEKQVLVEVKKARYRSAKKGVLVIDGGRTPVDFELDIDPRQIPDGFVTVRSSPSGCAVEIDGASAGATPVEKRSVRPGLHAVRVECDNYAPETRNANVESGQERSISFALRPVVFGYLTVRPVPVDGSEVRLNGRRIALPVEFRKVIPGRHIVEVTNDELRKKRSVTVNVRPEQRITRTVNLLQ